MSAASALHFIFVLRREQLILSMCYAIELNLFSFFARRTFHFFFKSFNFCIIFFDFTIFKRLKPIELFTSEVAFFSAEECRMVASFACKESWGRERISAGFYEWLCSTAAGEARKSGLARKDKKGYRFSKLPKKLLFFFILFSWMNERPHLILFGTVTRLSTSSSLFLLSKFFNQQISRRIFSD